MWIQQANSVNSSQQTRQQDATNGVCNGEVQIYNLSVDDGFVVQKIALLCAITMVKFLDRELNIFEVCINNILLQAD